jgi:hypothetical protein
VKAWLTIGTRRKSENVLRMELAADLVERALQRGFANAAASVSWQ